MDVCYKILTNQDFGINPIYIRHVLYNLLTRDINLVNNAIFEAFNKVTSEYNKMIQQKLSNMLHKYSIEEFNEMFLRYYSNSAKVINTLQMFEQVIANKENNYSYIGIMRKYLFYNNVINHKYNYNNVALYLYEILNQLISNSVDINSVIQLIKIQTLFTNFSYTAKQDRAKLFNIDIDQKFFIGMHNNQNLINDFVNYIDQNIRKKDNIDELKKTLKIVNQFQDKSTFYLYYKKSLMNRLLTLHKDEHDLEIENELLNVFTINNNQDVNSNNILCKMKYQIEDIKTSWSTEKIFHNKIPKMNSNRFKDYDVKLYNSKICTVNTFRSYAWDMNHYTNYIPNIDIDVYCEAYRKLYNVSYEDRKVNFNFDDSIGVIKLKFGNKHYLFEIVLSQMFVLLEIIKQKQITAKALGELLQIPENKLTVILNSLLIAKIIGREKGDVSDKNIRFIINKDCNFPDDNVSLVQFYKNLLTQKEKTKVQNNDSLLFSKIIQVLKKTGDATINQIYAELHNNKVDASLLSIKKVLDKSISSNFIMKDNLLYKYINTAVDSSDSETESDTEDETDKIVDEIMTTINTATEEAIVT